VDRGHFLFFNSVYPYAAKQWDIVYLQILNKHNLTAKVIVIWYM